MSAFFMAVQDQQQGPYSPQEMLGRGLTADTLVWREGMTEWQPAGTVPELSGLLQSPPPPPPAAASVANGAFASPPSYDPRTMQPHGNFTPQPKGYAQQTQPAHSLASQTYGATVPDPVRLAANNKIAAGLCGILLGALGIHKFVLGFTGAGLTMLLISVCSCGFAAPVMHVIGLIEGIIYLTKSDADFYQQYVVERRAWF